MMWCVSRSSAVHFRGAALLVAAAQLLTVAPSAAQEVSFDRLKRAAEESHNWLTYSGT